VLCTFERALCEGTKKVKPRRPEIFREASPPLDFFESRQKVASTFARDYYGNHPMAIGFTAELLRAAAGLRAGQNKKPQLIYKCKVFCDECGC
jgi:hypothetical protein